LRPGGWVEQVEIDPLFWSEPGDAARRPFIVEAGEQHLRCSSLAGRSCGMYYDLGSGLQDVGFVNVVWRDYRFPLGTWTGDRGSQSVGSMAEEMVKCGLEGWLMRMLVRYGGGGSGCWTTESVRVLASLAFHEIKSGSVCCWMRCRRVWAQKPSS